MGGDVVRVRMLGDGLRYIAMARTGLGCVNDVAVSRSLVSTTGLVTKRGIRVISGGGNRHLRACVVGNRHNDNYVYLGNTTTHGIRMNSAIVVVTCTLVSFRRTGAFGPAIIFPGRKGEIWCSVRAGREIYRKLVTRPFFYLCLTSLRSTLSIFAVVSILRLLCGRRGGRNRSGVGRFRPVFEVSAWRVQGGKRLPFGRELVEFHPGSSRGVLVFTRRRWGVGGRGLLVCGGVHVFTT